MNHTVSSVGEQGHKEGARPQLSFQMRVTRLLLGDLGAIDKCVPEDTVFWIRMKWKNVPPTWSLPWQPPSNPTFPLHLDRKWATHSVCSKMFSPEVLPSGFQRPQQMAVARDVEGQVNCGETMRFYSTLHPNSLSKSTTQELTFLPIKQSHSHLLSLFRECN